MASFQFVIESFMSSFYCMYLYEGVLFQLKHLFERLWEFIDLRWEVGALEYGAPMFLTNSNRIYQYLRH